MHCIHVFNHRRQSWAHSTSDFRMGGRGVAVKYYYILCCTEILDENTFQSGDFSEIDRFVYNAIKIPGIIPSIMCYMPLSVELLGPTTPSFQTRIHKPPHFKPD